MEKNWIVKQATIVKQKCKLDFEYSVKKALRVVLLWKPWQQLFITQYFPTSLFST